MIPFGRRSNPLPEPATAGQPLDGHPVAAAGRTCSGLSLRCTGSVAQPFRDPLDRRQTTFWMCGGCWRALNAMGAGLVAA